MTKIYIAGPMTGLPDLNYPAFHEAAAALRAAGHEVFNPAENPAPACGSWNGYMRMAIARLTQCEAIYLLHGWSASKGARLEYRIAQDFQLKPMFQHKHREQGACDWRESIQEVGDMFDRARLRAATSLQSLPPKAIAACVMREDGGEQPAYCLMAAYRSEADAVEALSAIASTEVQPEPDAWAAVYLGGKRAGKIYNTCDTQEQVLEYINLVEQSNDSITLIAKPVFFAAAPQAQPADALDAKRLDWMIEQRTYVVSDETCCDGYWLHWARPDGSTWVQGSEYETPRAAIDAAMAAAQEGGNAAKGA